MHSTLGGFGLLLLAALLGCGSPTAPEAEGTWGGASASLILTATGGEVSFTCAAGTIDAGWTIYRDGRFTATGQYVTGGGPIPPEGRPPHPARYSGYIQGNRMVLTVTITDLNHSLGPFRLLRNGPAVPELCK